MCHQCFEWQAEGWLSRVIQSSNVNILVVFHTSFMGPPIGGDGLRSVLRACAAQATQ